MDRLEYLLKSLKELAELLKSNYGPKKYNLYDPTVNVERKQKNTEQIGEGPNKSAKQYTTTGSSMDDARKKSIEKEQRKASKKSLKVYTPEEIKEFEEKRKANQ